MRSPKRWWMGCALGLMLGASCGAQAPETVKPETVAALHSLTQLAGVIFTGRVLTVRRHDAGSGMTRTVEIEFAVEDAVRGVNTGAYTLREWGGLWAGGAQRYRVGQRYLMVLYARSEAGLSSPVGGTDGAIPIGPGQSGGVVDLRWIATRAASYRPVVRQPMMPGLAHAYGVSGGNAAEEGTIAIAIAKAVDAEVLPEYGSVLARLRGWEEAGDATR